MTVSASGGQGNLGREMRRLTMPCNCCQISWAVKNVSLVGRLGADAVGHQVDQLPERRDAGELLGGCISAGIGSGLANITW